MNGLTKIFGCLTVTDYMRKSAFCVLILLVFLQIPYQGTNPLHPAVMPLWMVVLNTVLFPYSNYFALRIIILFIDNEAFFIFFSIFMVVVLTVMWILCWYLACIIAPLGLIAIYIYHSTGIENKLH